MDLLMLEVVLSWWSSGAPSELQDSWAPRRVSWSPGLLSLKEVIKAALLADPNQGLQPLQPQFNAYRSPPGLNIKTNAQTSTGRGLGSWNIPEVFIYNTKGTSNKFIMWHVAMCGKKELSLRSLC